MKFRLLVLMAVIWLHGCSANPAIDFEAVSTLRKTDPQGAATQLEKYLASKTSDDLAWTILGHAYGDLKRDDDAERAYKKALEINPRRSQAITGMGILCRKKGKYQQALDYYEQAIAIDPSYAQAYSSMTVIALKMGEDAKALEYAKKGYDLDQSDAAVAANLAIAYHYNNMLEQRDKLTQEAKRLRYAKIDVLEKLYSGEMTVRD